MKKRRVLTENELRYLVRSRLRVLLEIDRNRKPAKTQSSWTHPQATSDNLYLNQPMSVGGWPEGEYDPPVEDQLMSWFDDMDLIETKSKL